MRNSNLWKPSKFVIKKCKLSASRNAREVSVSSRLISDIIAEFYWIYLKEHCKGKLLDLGCGKAPLYEVYKDFITDSVCVDWIHTNHKTDHLDYNFDLTEAIPLPDREFDTVVLSDVLEHIPNPELLFNEISRLLRPGGKLVMNVPFYYWLHEEPHDYYRYTKYALKRFAKLSKIELIVVESLGGIPEILADILAKYFLFSVPKAGKYLSICVQYLCYKFIKTSLGARMSKQTGRLFPLGYFLIGEKLK